MPDTLGRITGPLARRLGPDVPLAPDRPLSTFHKGLYGFVSRTIPAEFPHLWGAPKELSHLFSVASSVRTGLSTLGTEPPALDFSPSAADGSGMPGLVPDYVWMAMPFVVAAGAALLTAILMNARTDAALACQRAALAEVRALLATQHRAMEERVRATEEEARRRALNEFLADVRVDERRFLIESRGTMLLQERVSFRNIPLTPWVDRELPASTPLPVPPPEVAAAPVRAEPARLVAPSRRLLR